MKAGTTLLMAALQIGQTGLVRMIDMAHSAQEATWPQSKKMTETKIFSDQNYLNKEKICKNVSFN
jgi:hypothetical protein